MDKANLFYRFVCDWCVILSLTPWAKLNQTSGKKKKTVILNPCIKKYFTLENLTESYFLAFVE